MTENDRIIAEDAEASKEEIALAADIMLAMVKTSKGVKMYLPNNPLLKKFIDDLSAKTARFLDGYGELKLDVDQFELRYKGHGVYENRDPKDSVAFKMYSDGIRSIIFSEGLEEHELSEYLRIVGSDRPSDVDDDIVTLLWEQDLPHLSYLLAEDYLDYDATVGGAAATGSQQDKIRGIYSSIQPELTATPLLVPQQILSLTEEETNWLRSAREAEEKRRPLDEVIQILATILNGVKDPTILSEFIDIMVKLTGNLLLSGETVYALNLIKFLHNLTRNERISPEQRRYISTALSGILSDDTIKSLHKTIDTTDLLTSEDLKKLLFVFGVSSVGAICELLGLVEKMKMRKVIIEVLIALGNENPQAFTPYLTDPRWYLVRNIVLILSQLQSPIALDLIVRLITHKEPRIRKEVLAFLERSPDPKAKTFLLKFLRDESSVFRIRALQILARSQSSFALKTIAAFAASEEFDSLDLVEKRAIYEALGELGGVPMIPTLKNMLMKRYLFNKAKEKEAVICAVAGLAKMRDDLSLKVLEEASAVKGDELRSIIVQAIQARSAEKNKTSSGHKGGSDGS